MNIDLIEKRALWVTVFANLVMSAAGWITFEYTGSQAMLLDGNFSFVLAIATLIAINISKNKHKKSATFPFGKYAYEAAFILSKGLLILGIVITAFFQNIIKIINYFQGEIVEPMVLTPIYIYTVFVLVITFSLLWFFNTQNKKVNNSSSLLLVETTSAKIDGGLTLATGMAFFLISFISIASSLDFLIYIGDSLIVILLCLIMIGSPIRIIKNAFIELGGGTLQNKQEKQRIETIVESIVSKLFTFNTFISKLGSGYLVVIYIDSSADEISLNTFREIQTKIKSELRNNYPNISVEIALKD